MNTLIVVFAVFGFLVLFCLLILILFYAIDWIEGKRMEKLCHKRMDTYETSPFDMKYREGEAQEPKAVRFGD